MKGSHQKISIFIVCTALLLGQVWAHASEIKVYKSATCGCCTAWIDHLKEAGFTVSAENRDDMQAIKAKYGIKPALASCHTAIVDGYRIEGHVPASDVKRLLEEKPDVLGLAAPGMPMQSPGMQAKHQAPKNYDVIAFDKDGNQSIFSHY